MKQDKLLNALGQVKEEFIEDAAPKTAGENKAGLGNKQSGASTGKFKHSWVKWGALAACVLLVAGISASMLLNQTNGTENDTTGNGSALNGIVVVEDQCAVNTTTQTDTGDVTKQAVSVRNEAGEGTTSGLVTMTHMEEILLTIDEMFPDGFRGTIEVGTDVFRAGEQITIVAQDNVTVVEQDGSIFDYNELEPNIKDSALKVGSSVWVGFQSYDYLEGNGKYNQIYAYHVEAAEVRENNAMNADEGFPDWGLTLSIENVTSTGLTLVVTQSGGNPTGTLQTGESYRLIYLVPDGPWKAVEEAPLPEGVDARCWNSIAYPLLMEDSREFEINWEWIYGELPSGTYRLVKEFMDFRKTADYDTFEYWVEFELE